jgi:hypothetical protein
VLLGNGLGPPSEEWCPADRPDTLRAYGGHQMSEQFVNWRLHRRLPVAYPVIFGGAPFVGEGMVSDLSHSGCSVTCERTVLMGSYIKLSVLLPDPTSSLFIELGKVRWVKENTFGVEFIRIPTITRHRLDRVVSQAPALEANLLPVPA